MTTNPRGRKARRRNDYQREKSLKGVDARRRIREARTEDSVTRTVGTVTFDGPYFCGPHSIRVAAVSDGRPVYDLIVDGELRAVRSERGVRSVIAKMIVGACAV